MSLKNTALYKAVVSNQQLFLQRGNPLCTRWLYFKKQDQAMDGRDTECMAGPSRAGNLIDHLAWRFPLFSYSNKIPHTNLETNPGYSTLGSSLQCDWRPSQPSPPTLPVWLFLHQLRGRKQTSPLNTSTLHSIQTEGPGIAVLPKI